MSLTESRLTEAAGMRGLEAGANRVTEDYVTAPTGPLAARFDNVADKLSIAATGISTSTVTMGFWWYFDVLPSGPAAFTGMAVDNGSTHYFFITAVSTNIMVTGEDDSSAGAIIGPAPTAGVWRYVAVVFNSGGTDTLYLALDTDLSLSSSSDVLVAPDPSGTFTIGNDGFTNFLNGRVAYARVWNAALTESELLAERASETAVRTSGLWADYPLQGDANDISGNARHLTAAGTVTYEEGPTLPVTKWVNRTFVQSPRNGTASHTINFPAATAGNVLVAIGGGPVTISTPTGWGMPAKALENVEMRCFTKIATAGESSFPITTGSNNYPLSFVVYEFPAGYVLTSALDTRGSLDLTHGLGAYLATDADICISAMMSSHNSTTETTEDVAWTAPAIEDVDVFEPLSGTSGYYFATGYAEDRPAGTWIPDVVINNGSGNITTTERIAVALEDTGGKWPMWVGVSPSAASDASSYELGTYFYVYQPVKLTSVRIMATAGTRSGRNATLWKSFSSSEWEPVNTLQTIDIPDTLVTGMNVTPFTYDITEPGLYCISYNSSADYYAISNAYNDLGTGGFADVISGYGAVAAQVNGGRFNTTVGSFPSSNFSNSYYGIDVTYEPLFTIGNTTVGGTSAATADNWQNEALVGAAYRYTAAVGDVVTDVAVYGDGTGPCEVGLYVFDGTVPTTKVNSTTVNIGATAGWHSVTVAWPLTAGVTYVVAIDYLSTIDSWNMRTDNIGGTLTSVGSGTVALPSTWTQIGTNGYAASYYVVVNHMTVYSDDFNRANGAVGANWDNIGDGLPPKVSSNVLVPDTSGDTNIGSLAWNTPTATFDQFSQATFTFNTLSDSNGHAILFVRTNSSATPQRFFAMRQNADTTTMYLRMYFSGGSNVASATNTIVAGVPQVWRIEVTAARVFKCYVDGVLKMSYTDPGGTWEIADQKFVGIGVRGTVSADDWSGG